MPKKIQQNRCNGGFLSSDSADAASPVRAGASQSRRAFFPFDAAGAASQLCKGIGSKRAFFSFDAAFAIVLCAVSFAGFSLLLSSASESASTSATSLSSSLLALRFSSFVLSGAQVQSPDGTLQPYSKSYELDMERLKGVDLQQARLGMGRDFASITVAGSGGTIFLASDGAPRNETYCTKRLALLDAEPVRLEVCIS